MRLRSGPRAYSVGNMVGPLRRWSRRLGSWLVLRAGPELEVLAVNDLNDGPDYTTPAVADGRLFIKGKSYLWCIGTR